MPGESVAAARRCRRAPRVRGARLHAGHLPQDRVHHYVVQKDRGENKQKIKAGISRIVSCHSLHITYNFTN